MKLKLVSDGNPLNTYFLDEDTGVKHMFQVSEVTVRVRPDSLVETTVVFCQTPIEVGLTSRTLDESDGASSRQ